MFFIALTIFIIYTVLYAIFSAAIFYHLYHFALPGHPAPKTAITLFSLVSGSLWITALIFLLKIPT